MDDATLLFLDQHVQPGMRTLETGSGISTIMFANKGAQHTCIAPDAEQVTLIQQYCAQHAIATRDLEFMLETSEDALPKLPPQEVFDLALIDGRHSFPNPIIDWYYIARVLKIGGLVVIDDLHIWTCELLVNFLRAEPDWGAGRGNRARGHFAETGQLYAEQWVEAAAVCAQPQPRDVVVGEIRVWLGFADQG